MISRILKLFLLAFNSQAILFQQCPQQLIKTPLGCAQYCKDQKFNHCPSVQDVDHQFNACGLSQDGVWASYANQCSACRSFGVIAAIEGPCWNRRDIAIPQEPQVIFSQAKGPINCPTDRPNIQNCPDLDLPELVVCGLTESGQKKGFNQACSACKDELIAYYYNTACASIGVEAQTDNVERGDYAQKQVIDMPKHAQNFCFEDSCCQRWEMCIQKKCTDRCMGMRCQKGCIRGQCQI